MTEALSGRMKSLVAACTNEIVSVASKQTARRKIEEAIGRTMASAAFELDTTPAYSVLLRDEYRALLDGIDAPLSDDRVQAALVRDADWSPEGAAEILLLARKFGVFGLRNALALAEAMGIEDGDSGM